MGKRRVFWLRAGVAAGLGGALSLAAGTAVSLFPEDPFEGYLAGTMIATALLLGTYQLVQRGDAASARRRAFELHSLLGLATGLVWLVFVFSGVLLMYRPELEAVANGWRSVEPLASHAPVDDWLAAVGQRADLRETREIQIRWPERETDPAVVWVHGGGRDLRFDVDPYRATILEGEFDDFMEGVRDLHTQLLLKEPGRWIGGLVSLATGWLVLSGVQMGGRVFRDAFRLRADRGSLVLLSDLHKRIAVWTLPLLAVYAFTGISYEWGGQVGRGPLSLRFDGDAWAMYQAAGAPPPVERGAPAPTPPIASFLLAMQERFPGSEPRIVRILGFGDAAAVVSVRATRAGGLGPLVTSPLLNFRAATGEVLLAKDVETMGPFARTDQALHALHYGRWASGALRALHALASVAMGLLPLLGIAIWWLRRRGRGGRSSPALPV